MPPQKDSRALAAPVGKRRHATGVILVLAAGVMLSIAGITLRHIESASGWQILFYRSLTFCIVIALWLTFRYRARVGRAFVAVGRPGLVVALSLGLGSTCYVFALLLTTVANALFLISAAPFMAAVLGWIVLRERVRPATWLTMTVALVGIAIMVFHGVQSGRLLGNLVALGTPISFAIMLVVLRRAGHRDMLPAICLAGVVGAVLGFAMSDTLVLSRHDLALCLFLGVFQYAGGFILITLGARYLPAAEVALISLAEVVLAPVWVWIGVGEVPAALTLVGGGIVLAAVVAQALTGMRSRGGG
ncbi:MAG: DMT family transporter [Thiotrichales bacterium]|nr:DMT family transporter [Thiotrichales bacterium]